MSKSDNGFHPIIERVGGFPVRIWFTRTKPQPVPDAVLGTYTQPFIFRNAVGGATDSRSATDSPTDPADPRSDPSSDGSPDAPSDVRAVATPARRHLPPQHAPRVLRMSLTAVLLALVASVAVAVGTVLAGPNEKPDHPGHPPKPSPGIGRSAEPPHGRPTPAPIATPVPTPTPSPTPGRPFPGNPGFAQPSPPVFFLPDTRSTP